MRTRIIIFLSVLFLAALSACTTPSILATQTIQRGDAANNQNKYEEAINQYESYLKLAPSLGLYRNPKMEGSVCRKLAHAYATQGKYNKAIDNLKKAIRIDSVAGNNLESIEDYQQLGIVYGYSGDYRTAQRYLEKSLVLNKGMENSVKETKRSSVAGTYLYIAQLNLTLGNYKKAQANAKSALEGYEKMQDGAVGKIEAELILGIIARELGDLKISAERIASSAALAKSMGFNVSRHEQALGDIFFLKGDPEQAIRHKLAAAKEAESSTIKPLMIVAYTRLGDAYQRLGDQGTAQFYYKKAFDIESAIQDDVSGSASSLNEGLGDVGRAYQRHQQSGSILGMALAGLRLGEQYRKNAQLDSSLGVLKKTKSLFTEIGSKEGIAKADIELAKVYIQNKSFTLANALLREAERITIQADLKWKTWLYRGAAKEGSNAYDSALICYRKSIGIIDEMRGNITIEEFKTLFANDKVEVYDRVILLLLKSYKNLSGYTREKAIRESFNYNEQSRSRAFLDMMGNTKIEAKNVKDEELLEREQLLKLKMQQLITGINSSESDVLTQQLNDDLHDAQGEYNTLIQEIKLKNAAYSTLINVMPPALSEVQAKLPVQTALLEYWISNESLIIWVITQKKVDAVIVPVSRKDIQRSITSARKSISLHVPDVASASLKSLNSYLIEPVRDQLRDIKNITIVPHKDLHFIPFQALKSPAGKFLIEQYVLAYAPSASVLHYLLEKDIASGNKFMGLALGDYQIGQFSPLPGTALELDQLSKVYPDLISESKEGSSETFFKANAGSQNYIHLATHGVLNKNQPLYSYLLMAPSKEDDGLLTVNEIFSMKLNTKFVTLSACETGLGDIGEGDDLVGLSRAFIYAGSHGVIVSLWKVDDVTTAWLMTRFHQYISSGYAASEALTFAQRDVIQRSFRPSQNRGLKKVELSQPILKGVSGYTDVAAKDPYYWGPFILIGNGIIK